MKKNNFSRKLFLKRFKTATTLFLKSIGKILLGGVLIALFISALWIATQGEFNPPALESILFYSTIFSLMGYIIYLYVKYNNEKIEEFFIKFE